MKIKQYFFAFYKITLTHSYTNIQVLFSTVPSVQLSTLLNVCNFIHIFGLLTSHNIYPLYLLVGYIYHKAFFMAEHFMIKHASV